MTTDASQPSQTDHDRSEYRRELVAWLRRRFRGLCLACITVSVVMLAWQIASGRGALGATGWVLGAGVAAAFLVASRRVANRRQLVHSASLMILLLGSISLVVQIAVAVGTGEVPRNMLLAIFFWHLAACLFLPWTPRESLRPVIPLLVVWAIAVLAQESGADVVSRVLTLLFSPGVFIPGLAICSWRLKRHSRTFRLRMVDRQFTSMRREFSRARTIHESVFPDVYDDGFVRFDYAYAPMRELGGDYVHVHVGAEGLLHLTLLDVTGHGLAAALTVNRIAGELERLRAESPRLDPDESLRLLNRYVHLTLSRHSIYATALCLTIDPYLGRVTWASGGHPPALLRRGTGAVVPMRSTAAMLGALGDEEFSVQCQREDLVPGDVIVAYTDGVAEARDRRGRQFGLDRVHDLMRRQPAPRNWPQFVSSMVRKHSGGRSDDDVLVACVSLAALRPDNAAPGGDGDGRAGDGAGP
ncbi:MAG: PP2C family protein-serine/threonine phosphatase [Planctomycetota bacterium]|jgi:hypothetical protein